MAKWDIFSKHELRNAVPESVVVIGLGRFGQAIALELMKLGVEVLGIDLDPKVVQELNGRLTHVVSADSTREEVLRQLAIPEMECAVVAVGDSVEASILTTSLLLSFDIPQIWAKAMTDAHGRILQQIGVHHVVYSDTEMGKRVAHLIRGSVQDYIELGDGLALVRTSPPEAIVGKSISEIRVRASYGVTIIAVKKIGGKWSDVTADTILDYTDAIMVTGPSAKAENFSRLN